MTESTSFYGSEFFYPGLYSLEEQQKIKSGIDRELWPMVLDLCVNAGKDKYYITTVNEAGKVVMLADKRGIPLLRVEASCSSFSVKNWHQNMKRRGADRRTVHSAKRPYVVNAVRPFLEPTIASAGVGLSTTLSKVVSGFRSHLNSVTNNANRLYDKSIDSNMLYTATRLLFEDGFTQVLADATAISTLKQIHEELVAKFANKKSYDERFDDMFSQPKWLLMRFAHGNQATICIGTIEYKLGGVNRYSADKIIMPAPLRLYRGLDHFYAENPDEADSLKSALTFCKVSREKEYSAHDTIGDEKLFSVQPEVYEDIGGMNFSAFDFSVNPSILLVNK